MANPLMTELVLFLFGMYMVLSIFCHTNLFEPKYVRDRVVLITDSTSKIGRQVALEYAGMKARLFLVGVDAQTLTDLTIELLKAGAVDVAGLAGDFHRPEYRRRLIPALEKRYDGHLHQLVFSHQPKVVNSLWNDTESVREAVDGYLMPCVQLASDALPLLKRNRGSIAVISTLPGKVSVPRLEVVASVKAALQAYLASVRQELKTNGGGDYVSVTGVSLAYVEGTEGEVERGRWGQLLSPIGTVGLKDAVENALHAIGGRKTEVTYPFAAQVHSWVHSWFPSLYENPHMPGLTHLLPSLSNLKVVHM